MTIPESRLRWLETLLAERFGQRWQLHADADSLTLRLPGQPGELIFDRLEPAFMRSGQPRGLDCPHWPVAHPWRSVLGEPSLPAPASRPLPEPLIELDGHRSRCHYDIPGLAFWALNRLEEIGALQHDAHQRFPASAAHASVYGYLHRPLVDEWLDLLGQMLQALWPQLTLARHHFRLQLSHDVDQPGSYRFAQFGKLLRTAAEHLLVHRNPRALLAPWICLRGGERLHPQDPANTFAWLMSQSEARGVHSTFYFFSGGSDRRYDADYDLAMPLMRRLLREIHQRGHQIGLHPSYHTFANPAALAREFERLRRICAEEGIHQRQWGTRMHYLRWQQDITLHACAAAGLAHDNTIGYADRPGFRCATCHDYPAYDIGREQTLALRIRPLIAMECTIIAQRYLGLGTGEAAWQAFDTLQQRCRQVQGTFSLLWHNSHFNNTAEFALYRRLISAT